MSFPVPGQFGFDLLDGRQAGVQGFRQGADELVFRDADWLVDAGKGVFGHHPVLLFTKQKSNAGPVVRGFDLGVHRRKVEIQLAGVLRFKVHALEFHHDVAFEAGVVEQQVDEEFVPADFKPELAADKGKARAQLQEEAGDMPDEGIFNIALVGFVAKAKKIEEIGVFEGLDGKPGLKRG